MLATGARTVVHTGGAYARYVPSGHLVYVNKGTIFAVPFDPKTLRVSRLARARWCRTSSGTRLKVRRSSRSRRRGSWATCAAGRWFRSIPSCRSIARAAPSSCSKKAGAYANPRLSPDGKRLALTVLRDGNWDIWVYDLERGVRRG